MNTPGPWRVDGRYVFDRAADCVCDTQPGMTPADVAASGQECAANAALIAAAPELLAALRDALTLLEQYADAEYNPRLCRTPVLCHQTRTQIRAAIAKAEGQ